MDRRVAILRFWLLCVVALAACAIWPNFAATLAAGTAFAPFGFLFPTCICCPGCTNCDPNYGGGYQVVASGFADGASTGCSVYNGTFETERFPQSGTTCVTIAMNIGANVSGGGILCDPGGSVTARVGVNESNNAPNIYRYTARFGHGVPGQPAIGALSHGDHYEQFSTPQDCASFSSLALPNITNDNGCCDLTSVSVEISAL